MSKRLLLLITGALVCLTVLTSTWADETLQPRPSPAELGQVPHFTQPTLSQTGSWFAAFGMIDGERTLMVENLENKNLKPYLVAGPDWHLRWYRWLADDRLLLSISTPETNYGVPVTVTRLVVVDPKKRKTRMMFIRDTNKFNYQIQDRVVSLLQDDPARILVSLNPINPSKPQVRRADLRRFRLSKATVQANLPGIHQWYADTKGNVRVGSGFTLDQGQPVLKLKDPRGKWRSFPEEAGSAGFDILALPSNNQDLLYVSSDHEHPLGAVYEFYISTGRFGPKLAVDERSAIASVDLDHAGNSISAIHFESELVPTLYLDPWLKRFNKRLSKLLPNTNNELVSVPENRKRAIIRSYASNVPPHYYLYEADKKTIRYISAQHPQLRKRALATTELTSYKARDDLEIPAYITLPSGFTTATAKNLPFVVLPHGGPHSRNFLRFDWLTQLFASQGYGVLQMNFRGSTGYGADFFRAGRRQWGQAMQDDVTDGTHWLVQQGLADPKRLCIAGGSYGGYAALMGLVKEPQLYRCAISLNGVTDLVALLSSSKHFIGGKYRNRFIGNLWRDRASLINNSPARQADKIQSPILLVQGEDDRVVDRKQALKMQAALLKAGKTFEYIELPQGDHYLSRETNRQAFANKATTFLAEHLGDSDSDDKKVL